MDPREYSKTIICQFCNLITRIIAALPLFVYIITQIDQVQSYLLNAARQFQF